MTDDRVVIEKVEVHGKKFRVTTGEGEYLFSEETVIRYGLFKGCSFAKSRFEEIVGEESYQALLNKAIKFLAHQERSVSEVEEYLRKRDADESVIARAIERLTAYGYLDDSRYAALVLDYAFSTRKGPRYLENRLRLKGVAPEIIAEVMNRYDEAREEKIVAGITDEFLRKNAGIPKLKLQRKLYQKLIRDGFSREIATRFVNNADYPPVDEVSLRAEIAKLIDGADMPSGGEKQRIIKKMTAKGYSYHDIIAAMDENE